ncbi:APY3 [Symbiodinium natans]|uniref:APY3 protein n=1 Tax=Symbiodinium natans TaxID=878477 RepID=A0A812SGA2_9DINO|nr:APY3 [Symbiodinium natans]
MPMSLRILALILSATTASTKLSWRYGAFIDAGSEGSRIYILRWQPADTNRQIIAPESLGELSTVPGIASFAQNPGEAGLSLKSLVEYMKQELKHEQANWAQTPLYLRATAGMRLLFPDQREDILDDIRSYFWTSPFLFRDDMASVATGEEEGVFGWISANYLMGNLAPDRKPASNTTVGSLDLGGASAQIVFMPKKSIIQHAFPLKLGPHRFELYSFSFLHFGVREAAHSTAGKVISDALEMVQSETEVYHPCFAKGYIYTPRFSYSTARFPAIKVKMQGTGNFPQCEKLIMRIFNKDAPCLVTQCSFYGVYQPRLYEAKFLAFAHFADIASDLGLPETTELEDFRAATQYVCSLTIEVLNSLFSRVEDEYDRVHLCFHATFAYVLLSFGYGMEERNNIVFKTSHAGKPIDWAVGAMIYEINQDIRLSIPLTNVSVAS